MQNREHSCRFASADHRLHNFPHRSERETRGWDFDEIEQEGVTIDDDQTDQASSPLDQTSSSTESTKKWFHRHEVEKDQRNRRDDFLSLSCKRCGPIRCCHVWSFLTNLNSLN